MELSSTAYSLFVSLGFIPTGGDFNTGPEKTEGSPFQILTSRGLTNSVQEIFYKLDAWLHTEFSTYGNPRNTFSYTYRSGR